MAEKEEQRRMQREQELMKGIKEREEIKARQQELKVVDNIQK
jgi:hypothetical protein